MLALSGSAEHVRRNTEENPEDPVRMRLLALTLEHGRVRPSEVAEELEVSPPSVTRYVHALRKEGQISVVADPDDGRSYLIEVTEAGREVVRQFRDGLVDIFCELLSDWSPKEVATLARLLGRLNEEMTVVSANRRSPRGAKNWWREGSEV